MLNAMVFIHLLWLEYHRFYQENYYKLVKTFSLANFPTNQLHVRFLLQFPDLPNLTKEDIASNPAESRVLPKIWIVSKSVPYQKGVEVPLLNEVGGCLPEDQRGDGHRQYDEVLVRVRDHCRADNDEKCKNKSETTTSLSVEWRSIFFFLQGPNSNSASGFIKVRSCVVVHLTIFFFTKIYDQFCLWPKNIIALLSAQYLA